MAWPVIKINCEIDKDYLNLLDNCIKEAPKLIEGGSIDKSVSIIEEEDYRELIRKKANELYGKVAALMEKTKGDLEKLDAAPSVVDEDEEYPNTYKLSKNVENAVEDSDELISALEKFLDTDNWMDVEYNGTYVDDDGETEDIYYKYAGNKSTYRRGRTLEIEFELDNLLDELRKDTARFYVY
jgi:hypothetical protein